MNLPITYSIEVPPVSKETESFYLLDRQITGTIMDTRETGIVILVIQMKDKIQIKNRILEIPWEIKIRLVESKDFKIIK